LPFCNRTLTRQKSKDSILSTNVLPAGIVAEQGRDVYIQAHVVSGIGEAIELNAVKPGKELSIPFS
jgi:hypothetical protein